MSKYNFFRQSEVARNVKFDLNHLKNGDLDDLAVVLQLYYSLEFAIGQKFSDGDLRYHPNASFSAIRFISNLRMIQKLNGVGNRFLDVGCGLGSKVWIAQALGFEAHGLEINPNYAAIAGECVGTDRIVCHDGITFPAYDHYDVIYFYNPMPTNELETAILKNAKKGAIIYHAIDLQKKTNRAHARLSARVLRLTGENARLCQILQRKSQFVQKKGSI
jgi:hypothetical protein